jgi:hypothetical protein
VAVIGKETEKGELVFTGEVLKESLDSLHEFFREARFLMRRYPVGKLRGKEKDHLGFFIAGLLEVVLRPFLEKWQASYHHWWEKESDDGLPPFERQKAFPRLDEMLADWKTVRRFCRESAEELTTTFNLPAVTGLEPPGLRQAWLEETKQVSEN